MKIPTQARIPFRKYLERILSPATLSDPTQLAEYVLSIIDDSQGSDLKQKCIEELTPFLENDNIVIVDRILSMLEDVHQPDMFERKLLDELQGTKRSLQTSGPTLGHDESVKQKRYNTPVNKSNEYSANRSSQRDDSMPYVYDNAHHHMNQPHQYPPLQSKPKDRSYFMSSSVPSPIDSFSYNKPSNTRNRGTGYFRDPYPRSDFIDSSVKDIDKICSTDDYNRDADNIQYRKYSHDHNREKQHYKSFSRSDHPTHSHLPAGCPPGPAPNYQSHNSHKNFHRDSPDDYGIRWRNGSNYRHPIPPNYSSNMTDITPTVGQERSSLIQVSNPSHHYPPNAQNYSQSDRKYNYSHNAPGRAHSSVGDHYYPLHSRTIKSGNTMTNSPRGGQPTSESSNASYSCPLSTDISSVPITSTSVNSPSGDQFENQFHEPIPNTISHHSHYVPHHSSGPTSSYHHSASKKSVWYHKESSDTVLQVINLPKGANLFESLNEHFRQFGKVVHIDTSIHQGTARVQFESRSQALAALSSPLPICNNRFVKVFAAKNPGDLTPIHQPRSGNYLSNSSSIPSKTQQPLSSHPTPSSHPNSSNQTSTTNSLPYTNYSHIQDQDQHYSSSHSNHAFSPSHQGTSFRTSYGGNNLRKNINYSRRSPSTSQSKSHNSVAAPFSSNAPSVSIPSGNQDIKDNLIKADDKFNELIKLKLQMKDPKLSPEEQQQLQERYNKLKSGLKATLHTTKTLAANVSVSQFDNGENALSKTIDDHHIGNVDDHSNSSYRTVDINPDDYPRDIQDSPLREQQPSRNDSDVKLHSISSEMANEPMNNALNNELKSTVHFVTTLSHVLDHGEDIVSSNCSKHISPKDAQNSNIQCSSPNGLDSPPSITNNFQGDAVFPSANNSPLLTDGPGLELPHTPRNNGNINVCVELPT